MKKTKRHNLLKKALLPLIMASVIAPSSYACTRTLYVGENNTVITGRSMDWAEDMASDLWAFPAGISRTGEAGENSPKWTSKYGSVVASVYGLASADGMNEKGLVMNLLYLSESDYGVTESKDPNLSISLWGQYALDNFATVAEAVDAMKAKPFHIVAPALPSGQASSLHLSLTDASGDSAIFEYIKGKLIIHHGKEYTVLTNSPVYSQQLALNEYWQSIGGQVFLPGTSRAADRFARASFYINAVPKSLDKNYIRGVPDQSFDYQAVAEVMSVMRSVSVPLGLTTPGQPNIASTIWRTASDQKNLMYYFDSSTRPSTFWVSMSKLNLKPGAPILKLDVASGQVYSGEVSTQFKPATPFAFMPATGN